MIGGSGHVSGRVLHYAVNGGHHVTAITRGKKAFPEHHSFTHIKADRDNDNLSFIAKKYNYDVVLDIICRTPTHAKQSIQLASKCKRLVMVSTDYVYEPMARKLFLKENEAIFSNHQDYGGDKRRAEKIIIDAENKGMINATILRPPHIYGPGSNPGTIPQHGRSTCLLDQIISNETLNLLYGGLGLIQPIHVDDFAKIILLITFNEESFGEAYTVAGAELMTHLDYYNAIADTLGRKLTVTPYIPTHNAQDVNNYVVGHRCYDMSKLNSLFPNIQYIPFKEGIAKWVNSILKK